MKKRKVTKWWKPQEPSLVVSWLLVEYRRYDEAFKMILQDPNFCKITSLLTPYGVINKFDRNILFLKKKYSNKVTIFETNLDIQWRKRLIQVIYKDCYCWLSWSHRNMFSVFVPYYFFYLIHWSNFSHFFAKVSLHSQYNQAQFSWGCVVIKMSHNYIVQ